MGPAIYGFMRVATDDESAEEAARIKRELTEYANREGFTLEQVFTEYLTNSDSAFYATLNALERGEVKDVIVPSLWHFARLPGLQEAMKQHIELETGASVDRSGEAPMMTELELRPLAYGYTVSVRSDRVGHFHRGISVKSSYSAPRVLAVTTVGAVAGPFVHITTPNAELRSSPHRARSRSLTPHRQRPALGAKLIRPSS